MPFNVCSLYLHVALGLAQENLGLLAATGLALAGSPHAFITGVGWQVGPDVIQQAHWTRKAAIIASLVALTSDTDATMLQRRLGSLDEDVKRLVTSELDLEKALTGELPYPPNCSTRARMPRAQRVRVWH